MNNSDLIAALSLAITAIIFLVQTDDGLLQLKTKRHEKWIVAGILIVIILLINHKVFERCNATFYTKPWGFYLLPTEWALILFLYLLSVTLYRIFTPKIFNHDNKIINTLIERYRREKKWNKLRNLLINVMALPNFDKDFAEHLNDTIFNDHHLIEYFASDYPEILSLFCKRYPSASIAHGEHFFYILNGLFADKSNPIFSEIRQYHNDEEKEKFLEQLWTLCFHDKFNFDPQQDYQSKLPIISWLTAIISSYPSNLKEEISYYFRQFPETASTKNNQQIFTEEEIERLLSRDTVYNLLRLFRILLVEYCLTNQDAPILIDRVLLLLYSSWEHVEKSTRLESNNKVFIPNGEYTINEYFLQYLFYSYLSVYFLLQHVRPYRIKKGGERHDSSTWPLKQLFAKLDSLLGNEGIVSERSKMYYMESVFELYFDMPDYFEDEKTLKETSDNLLWYIKDSLSDSPYGDVELFRKVFIQACDHFDFLKYNNSQTNDRTEHFYEYLRPYTNEFKWRITQSIRS